MWSLPLDKYIFLGISNAMYVRVLKEILFTSYEVEKGYIDLSSIS